MKMRFLFALVLLTLFFCNTADAQTSCLKFPSNSVPVSGYGASWDVFSSAKELLVQTNCPESGTSLGLTVGKGSTSQLVYNVAYGYRADMNPKWQPTMLTGLMLNGVWLTGAGTSMLTAPENASLTNPFYFVAYVCTNRSGVWKCGCSDATCAIPKWQLQAYTGIDGGLSGGGSIRAATAKIFLVPHSCCDGPIASLAGASTVSTKYIYLPGSQNAVKIGDRSYYDHSLSGIDDGAQKAVDLIVARSDGWKNMAAIADMEGLQAINVPSEFMPYDPVTQDDQVTWYRTNIADNLRRAAIRFNGLMYASMHKKLTALGHGDFELGAWGFPNKMKRDDTYSEMLSISNFAKNETWDSVIKPNLSFGVPSSYFSFTPSMATAIQNGSLTRDEVIDWLVNSAKAARATYPPEFKILPMLWPYCNGTCPFDSPVVPPGWMRELAERLLDEAHVDGFSVWRSSGDDDHGSSGTVLFSARWQEVVDVINERGTFRSAR